MYKKISDFLLRWETRQLQAYIPCRKRNFTGLNKFEDCGDVIASSGVTIGTGLDLGQQTEERLQNMGIELASIIKMRPYIGKIKMDAVAALRDRPLRITDAECDQLDRCVHTTYIDEARVRYNRASSLDFDQLPWQAQAVIVSLGYQLGGSSRYPTTWKHLVAGDWQKAAWELRHGFKNYANRRADEARLLEQI